MNTSPCPKCASPYPYEDGDMIICPECAHQWSIHQESETKEDLVLDANGTPLADGDTVVVIKDLKVKGASNPIKQGMKVKNIKINPGGNHNISCRIDGFGAMELKSEFLKKI